MKAIPLQEEFHGVWKRYRRLIVLKSRHPKYILFLKLIARKKKEKKNRKTEMTKENRERKTKKRKTE